MRCALTAFHLGTECAGHATDLAHRAVAERRELVIAAGGDGTIHEVAQLPSRTAAPTRAQVPSVLCSVHGRLPPTRPYQRAELVPEQVATDHHQPYVHSAVAHATLG